MTLPEVEKRALPFFMFTGPWLWLNDKLITQFPAQTSVASQNAAQHRVSFTLILSKAVCCIILRFNKLHQVVVDQYRYYILLIAYTYRIIYARFSCVVVNNIRRLDCFLKTSQPEIDLAFN